MSRVDTITVRYRDLFQDREFSALFVADIASRTGSQLGKFALAALVYERTRSAGLAALTFATTYLPGLIGGPILSTLADRLPRRQLLIGCDIVRAALMGGIAALDMPIGVALGLLLLVELVKVPFGAARLAILADILQGERFAVGNALVGAGQQAVQVIGLGLGGFVIIGVGAQGALLADTGSYLLSAFLVWFYVRRRPAAAGSGKEIHPLRDTAEGIQVVRRTGQLPTLFWLLFLGPTVLGTAEGLAIAYAYELGESERLAGAFLAAAPLGAVLGLVWVGRMSPRVRARVLIPFSLTVGLCVATTGLVTAPAIILAAMFVAGVAMGHVAHLQASIVRLIEPEVRGRVIGLANTVLQLGQAASVLLAGFVAESTSIRSVLVVSGISATLCVFIVSVVGSPYAGRHRADPRALRRARRRRRNARRAAGYDRGRVANRRTRDRYDPRPRRSRYPSDPSDPSEQVPGRRPRPTDRRYPGERAYPGRAAHSGSTDPGDRRYNDREYSERPYRDRGYGDRPRKRRRPRPSVI